jgi:hypothetical protein
MHLLITSIESLPFSDVYAEWCKVGYNRAVLPTQTIVLEWRKGMRENPQLVNIVSAQVRRAGFVVRQTRNWGSKDDFRIGVTLTDDRPVAELGEMGAIKFRLLAFNWIEAWVKTQYLLHMLGVDTHYEDSNESDTPHTQG